MVHERVAIYTRVSTSQQEVDGTSHETQAEACHRHASERGYTVVGIYADTWTGAEYRERPALTELRRLVAGGGADVVLCYALDRLSRDQIHVAVLIDEIEHAGARLELVTERFDDTPAGRLIRSVQAFAAELEREKIVERTSRGRLARVQSGKPLAGPAPIYGYRWVDEEKTRLEPDPLTAPIVVRIFRAIAAGESFRRICSGLERDGIPTPYRRRSKWDPSTIAIIASNSAYTGEAYGWRGTIRLPDGVYPPLIDKATFEVARKRVEANRYARMRHGKHAHTAHLRAGLALCGHCGYPLTLIRNRYNTSLYGCRSRRYYDTDCTTHSAPVAVLDEAALDAARQLLHNPDVVAALLAPLAEADDDAEEREAVAASIRSLERRQRNLIRNLARFDDPDTTEIIRAQIDEYTAQLRALRQRYDELRAHAQQWSVSEADARELVAWGRTVIDNLADASVDERRRVLETFGVRVYLYRRAKRSDPPNYRVVLPEPLHSLLSA